MAVTTASFRTDFPEFASKDVYPDSRVTLWLGVASKRLDACRWGDLLDIGTELFVAHNLVLAARATASAAAGGIPGATVGVQTAKAVDKVSASYDASSTTNDGAGNWNATDYGVRYWEMAQLIGAGGMQL